MWLYLGFGTTYDFFFQNICNDYVVLFDGKVIFKSFFILTAYYFPMIKSKILGITLKDLPNLILIHLSSQNFFLAYTGTVYSGQIKLFSASLVLSHSSRALWILLCLKYLFSTLLPCYPNHPLTFCYRDILHEKTFLPALTLHQILYWVSSFPSVLPR